MDKPLWKFIDNQGAFLSETANQINGLYFPLCNSYPFMSSISPDLHGDIKTDYNSFLLEPVSRVDLTNLKISRNFWIYINPAPAPPLHARAGSARRGGSKPQKIWSATGVSKDIHTIKKDHFQLEAGLLWQKITRQNKEIGLKSEITSFVPASAEPVEIMRVDITNISDQPINFIPTAAIPIFGRSADNLHDHRHVTSLLTRIEKEKFGVVVQPTLLFDEAGHKKNDTSYFVWGIDEDSFAPEHIYPTQEEFTGDGSDLEAPDVILNNLPADKKHPLHGREAMAGLKFKTQTLRPTETRTYIILMGIVKDKTRINRIFHKFNTPEKINKALEETRAFWQEKSSQISVNTPDKDFDNWLRWVEIQPILRKIFGCSFLPDFDYGKGGRGWRDLWQDGLSIILNRPQQTRSLLINNFSGVRIDGSNATIIGQKPGEFIADRNNIARIWMDHGVWPLITTLLYIHQTGDLKIVLDKTGYFRDHRLSRSRERDSSWSPRLGNQLKTKTGRIYKGTILEHLLIQNLVQFFNVGPHNHIRLENADWNDGLDMAVEYGESVAFSCMYAQNLISLSEILSRLNLKNLLILKELKILLNRPNYSDINQKHKILDQYFQAVKYKVSGEKISIPVLELTRGLKEKAQWLISHIRKTEWLREGFFNGYYNNDRQRVEGKLKGRMRMTLTGQTFPVMAGLASPEQIKIIFKNVKKYLKDSGLGGFRLNTDFKKEQPSLGRAFSFIYGDKENGACFNHMGVMFAYALYKRGFAREGYEVIDSIYNMALDTAKSKIYPCLPEYFDAQGRGMYSYLTGSASWFVLTLLTQVFGIRGEYGDLTLQPKLTAQQFQNSRVTSISCWFAQKRINLKFINPNKKDYGKYKITAVRFNGKIISEDICRESFVIPRQKFLALSERPSNIIEVILD